jgi:hypothetical protein
MALVIEHALNVAAPASRVWQVVCDLGRYPEWNPFVVSCSSTLAVGDPIAMRVRLFAAWAQPQQEQIFEHEPGRRLCYGLARGRLGALASRRSHEVAPSGAASARYVSRFELWGWLAPLVAWLLGRRLAAGFAAMSTALVARAEALER